MSDKDEKKFSGVWTSGQAILDGGYSKDEVCDVARVTLRHYEEFFDDDYDGSTVKETDSLGMGVYT